MAEARSIARRKSTDHELSFDSFRSEAIKLLQKVLGWTWTDYNLHDSGITILEQLIYAFTDLIYRSEFELQDYLVDKDGNIDLAAQNLQQPAEIFSCRPATALDYRKLMLDAVPVVDNVWITVKPAEPGTTQCRGLYRVLVKLAQGLDQTARDEALEQLRATYYAARNLCEDLDSGDIEIVDTLEYELCARIEVSGARHPADILADIYFACARGIASSVSITNYDQLSGQVPPLDQLFDGPLTRHGIFTDDETREQRSGLSDAALFAAVKSIEGVNHIQQLYLAPPDNVGAGGFDQAIDLYIPGSIEEVRVELTINGRAVPFGMAEFGARYKKNLFKYYSTRSTPQQLSLLYQPITGVSRAFDQYFSIQNHFPVSYGVNQHGVPASAGPDVKARTRQLKAYLLIFEQLMVNFLANIDALKTLFSTQHGSGASYAVQTLNRKQVADLSAIYPQKPGEIFSRIVARFDNHNERKSRLLDYLLAIYGERFSQNSLRHFNFYYGKDEIEAVVVANKIAYLESIVELGRDRAAAPDYHGAAAALQRSGLAVRTAMFLGFALRRTNSLTAAIGAQGFGQLEAGAAGFSLTSKAELAESGYERLEQAPLSPPGEQVSVDELRADISDIIPLDSKILGSKLLTDGIYIRRYRIGSAGPDQDLRLLLMDDADRYWDLGGFADSEAAIKAANSLRQLLLALNRDSEGLHIVEHLLLRPRAPAVAHSGQDEDFYSFKISVIFPNWTTRCCNRDFRKLAEETLLLNAPAHVFPEFCWLDYIDMKEFEALFDTWQMHKTSRDTAPSELDRSAARLADFLRERHAKRQTGE